MADLFANSNAPTVHWVVSPTTNVWRAVGTIAPALAFEYWDVPSSAYKTLATLSPSELELAGSPRTWCSRTPPSATSTSRSR